MRVFLIAVTRLETDVSNNVALVEIRWKLTRTLRIMQNDSEKDLVALGYRNVRIPLCTV